MRHPTGQAIVVTGPPGAGKSTVSVRLAALLHPSAHVAGDAVFAFVRNGAIDPWLEEAAEQNTLVLEAAALSVGRLARRYQVVYDGVLGPWFLPTFVGAAGLESVQYALLLPPLSVCVERVVSRRDHGFRDREATERMWHEFRDGVAGLEEHVVDATGSPDEIADLIVRRLLDGSLRYAGAASSP